MVCKPKKTQGWQTSGCPWNAKKSQDNLHLFGDPIQGLPPLPWCDIRVIGPSTSSSLIRACTGPRRRTSCRTSSGAWHGTSRRDLHNSAPRPPRKQIFQPCPASGPLGTWRDSAPQPILPGYASIPPVPRRQSQTLIFRICRLHFWSNYYKNINRRITSADFQNVLRNMLHNSFTSFGVTAPVTDTDLQELGESFKKRVIDLATMTMTSFQKRSSTRRICVSASKNASSSSRQRMTGLR